MPPFDEMDDHLGLLPALADTSFGGGEHSEAPSVPPADELDASSGSGTVVIIDNRALARDCLARALKSTSRDECILTFANVDEWQQQDRRTPVALVVLCVGRRRTDDHEVSRAIRLLADEPDAAPVVLLSDVEDANQILTALERGVRGYIPTSASLNVAVEAMRLVKAGGTYLPATSLLNLRRPIAEVVAPPEPRSVFTKRQQAVLRAVREGKANKIIAYELNMKESTVKVHVRNIMRKLKAKNRTQVAFKTLGMFEAEGEGARVG